MSAPKTWNRYGVLANLETAYLDGGALADATHGIGHVLEAVNIEPAWADDGARAMLVPGSMMANAAPVAKSGLHAEVEVQLNAAGPGLAYAVARFPSIHLFLRAMQHQVTTVTTASSESQTYTIAPETASASLGLRSYVIGQQHNVSGLYGSRLQVEFESGRIPTWTFAGMGRLTAPTDVALPAVTYGGTNREAETVPPQKFEAGAVTLGGVSAGNIARVLGGSITWERELSPRALDNSTGLHGGFTPGPVSITGTLRVEALPLATMNPYSWESAQTGLAFAATFGATQYRRYTIGTNAATTCYVRDITHAREGATAVWELEVAFHPTTPVAADALQIAFN